MHTKPFTHVQEMLQARVAESPNAPFLRYKTGGGWQSLSWREGAEQTRRVTRALKAIGFAPGDRVALLGNTTERWILADLGIVCGGGIAVPIYHSNLPDDCHYILDNSEAKLLFVQDAQQLEKAVAVRDRLPKLERVVVMDNSADDSEWTLDWDEFLAKADDVPDSACDEWAAELKPETLLTFVYTSGTTGPPKGVMLTHGNFVAVTQSVALSLQVGTDDSTLLYLPLAHIFARIIEIGALRCGYEIVICEGIDKIMDNLGEVRPTFFPSVPRIFEKAYAKITAQVASDGGTKAKIFGWAQDIGRQAIKYRQARRPLPLGLAVQHRLADKLVYSKLKDRFGGRIRFFVSGGAPLSREIAEFFAAADLLILEGYGMTETTAVTNVNRPDHWKLGTVGPTAPGVEQQIAADGEILSRGPGIMVGYYKRDEDTKETLTDDGWLHTGDIGEFDDDGFLKITDRKKDIIVTAGGKNVAPQNIENLMKTAAPISQIMVYGDKRKYLVALVTLDPETTAEFCKNSGTLSPGDTAQLSEAAAVLANPAAAPDDLRRADETRVRIFEQLVDHADVVAWVEGAIIEKNNEMASYERIKKFQILPGDFSIEGGELTPTLKVKRKVVTERHRDRLDGMYEEKYD